MLENEADVALLDGLLRRILVAEEDRAFGRAFEPGDQPQQRGLAGAGGAEERNQFTRPDIEGNVFERGKTADSLRMFWTRTSMEVWTFQCLRLAAISSL